MKENKGVIIAFLILILVLLGGWWLKENGDTLQPVNNTLVEANTTPGVSPIGSESNGGVILAGTAEELGNPVEDAGYKYKIVLDKPFEDTVEDGYGNKTHESMVVVAKDKIIEDKIIDKIGKSIRVRGQVEWCLAETRCLVASEVE